MQKQQKKSIGTVRKEKRRWKKINGIIEHTGNESLDIQEEYRELLLNIERLEKLGLSEIDISAKLGKTLSIIRKAIYTRGLMKDLGKIDCPSLTRYSIGKSLTFCEEDVEIISDNKLKEFYDKLYFGKIKSPHYFGPSCKKWVAIYIYGENGKPEKFEEIDDKKESNVTTVEEKQEGDINEALPALENVSRSDMEKALSDLYLKKVKTVVKVISKETKVDEDTVYKVMTSYKKNFGGWV